MTSKVGVLSLLLIGCGAVDGGAGDTGGDDVSDATFTVSIRSKGVGTGSVATSRLTNCGTSCEVKVPQGEMLTLTATANADSVFDGWSGNGGCVGNPCAIEVTADVTINAQWVYADTTHYTLLVKKNGNGKGSVVAGAATSPTISCGDDCTETYEPGVTVELFAAGDGSAFMGWSGGGCSGTGSCVTKMDSAQTVTATFTATTWDSGWSTTGTTFSDNDLAISGNTSANDAVNVRTTVGKSSGKWYWEVTATGGDGTTNAGGLGIMEANMPNTALYIGHEASGLSFGYGSCCTNQYWVSWNGVSTFGAPPSSAAVKAGNVYMFALDMDTGQFWAGHDGTWYIGDPSAGTSPIAKDLTGIVYPGVTQYTQSINAYTANFGLSPFVYSVPAGFNAGLY